jgi:hypothetical protein
MAVGDDNITVDLLKQLGDSGLKIMTALVNKIYMRGDWPKDVLDVTMIALPKKNQAKKCSDHRTISLNTHTGKIVARFYVWSIALYGSEIWTLSKLERKYLKSFVIWCWRRMEKIKLSEQVTNEQVLDRIGDKRTLLNNILRRTANFIGHFLRINCLHGANEGQMTEVKGVERRRTQLLDDLRNKRRYWELKEEAEV